MKRILKKIFFTLLSFLMINPFYLVALAEDNCNIKIKDGEGSANLDELSGCMESRYGADQDVLRRAKRDNPPPPEVRIFFDNTNPKEGDLVTATAMPMYFRNSLENLYYTWYLVHTRESLTPNSVLADRWPTPEERDNCLPYLDRFKNKSAQIMARGSFDPDLFGIDYDALMSDSSYIEDGDGFLANFGGVDGVGVKSPGFFKICETADDIGFDCSYAGYPESYIYGAGVFAEGTGVLNMDYWNSLAKKEIVNSELTSRFYKRFYGSKNNTGARHIEGLDVILTPLYGLKNETRYSMKNYAADLKTGGPIFGNTDDYKPAVYQELLGDGKFGIKEERAWGLDPTNPDTDGDGVPDEADLMGVNQQTFTWTYREGDHLGVSVQGTSIIPINEGTHKEENATTLEEGYDPAERYNKYLGEDVLYLGDNIVTGYYKVMEAKLGKCNDENWNFPLNDGCVTYGTNKGFPEGANLIYDSNLKKNVTICGTSGGGSIKELDPCLYGQCPWNIFTRIKNGTAGFSFDKVIPVTDANDRPLDVELLFSNKQVSSYKKDGTDDLSSGWLSAKAVVTDEQLNADYLYYTWNFYLCENGDLDNCNMKINESLGAGSHLQGLGLKEVKFKLDDFSF